MIAFSLNGVRGADAYSVTVWNVINDNVRYFKKFNGDRWYEAVHRTYMFALEHRNDKYDDILPYIKKLARTILSVKERESSFGIVTDDGEIAPVFSVLRDTIDTVGVAIAVDGMDEIKGVFKELYLLDPESFVKLKALYNYDEPKEITGIKGLRIKNQKMNIGLRDLTAKYGSDYTFKALYEFFAELPALCEVRQTNLTKEVVLKPSNHSVIAKISDEPLIRDSSGNEYSIDKNTLTMDGNPDYMKWDTANTALCDILRIDISAFMNLMYEEVYVDEGVNTRHITWCGDRYRLETPGGVPHICMDREKFLSLVRNELILNLLSNNVGSLIAVSPDNVYVKPARAFQFDKVRLKFTNGKLLDLPIHLHIKKRKR